MIENWTIQEINKESSALETRLGSKTTQLQTRIQDIEKDLGNLTTAPQTFQIQRREAEMLSERVAILLSYIQGHSKYIWKTLQFLSDFCIHTFDDYIW